MTVESAGLVLYRVRDGKTEVLLVHPGGPFWKRRDEGAWSIPKGEMGPGESRLDVARREFQEELGVPLPEGEVLPLGSVRQAGGKVVHAWAAPGDHGCLAGLQQHVRHRVAAAIGQDAGISGSRQGSLVRPRCGTAHDPRGARRIP